MKKTIAIIISLIMVIMVAPAALAADTFEISGLNNGAICNIQNVTFTVNDTVTNVSVDDKTVVFSQTGDTVSFDASTVSTLKTATIRATAASGSDTRDVVLERFLDYTADFPQVNNASRITYDGWSGGSNNGVPGIGAFNINTNYFGFSKVAKATAGDYCLRLNAKGGNSSSTFVSVPYIGVYLGINDFQRLGKREGIIDFYADIMAEQTDAGIHLDNTNGIGNVLQDTGKFLTSDISYAANTWYTLRVRTDTFANKYSVYVKETDTPGATEQLIGEGAYGDRYRGCRLTPSPAKAGAAFNFDNVYQTGMVVMAGVSGLYHNEDGVETSVGTNPVSIFDKSLKVKTDAGSIGALENVTLEDSDGNSVPITVGTGKSGNNDTGSAYITVQPKGILEEKAYKIVLGSDLLIDNTAVGVEREIPFNAVATFGIASPMDGSSFVQPDSLTLSAGAPKAESVKLTLDGEELTSVQKAGNIYSVTLAGDALKLGEHIFGAMAVQQDGTVEYAESSFTIMQYKLSEIMGLDFNSTGSIGDNVSSGAFSVAGSKFQFYNNKAFHLRTIAEGRTGEEGDTCLKTSFVVPRTENNGTYAQFDAGQNRRFTGRIVVSADLKSEPGTGLSFRTTGILNQYYGSVPGSSLGSGSMQWINTCIEFNGDLTKDETGAPRLGVVSKWGTGEWFKFKVIFDTDKGTIDTFENDTLISSRTMSYKGIGHIFRFGFNAQDMEKTAGIYIDNLSISHESTIPTATKEYVKEGTTSAMTNNIIPAGTTAIRLTLDKMLSADSLEDVELWLGGQKVEGAVVTLEKSEKDTTFISFDKTADARLAAATTGYGSIINVALPAGILENKAGEIVIKAGASVLSALDVQSSRDTLDNVYTLKLAELDKDAVYPVFTGNEGGAYISAVTPVLFNGNKVKGVFSATTDTPKAVTAVLAVYNGDKLSGVKLETINIGSGNNMYETEEMDISEGCTAKCMVWDSTSNISPLISAGVYSAN